MNTLIQISTTRCGPHQIARSLGGGGIYYPNWRFRLCEQYWIKIQQARDESAALTEILREEVDPDVRELLLYQSGGPSEISKSIEYAVAVHRSQHESRRAWKISAMVVAGRSYSQIAEEMGTDLTDIVTFENIFFDVRRFLELRLWLTELCHSSGSVTGLSEGASRWLIRALRGWDALAAMISSHQLLPESRSNHISEGKQLIDEIHLATLTGLADLKSSLDMKAGPLTAMEMDYLMQSADFAHNLASTLSRVDYPRALSPSERKEKEERDELIAPMSFASRRKVLSIMDRLMAPATPDDFSLTERLMARATPDDVSLKPHQERQNTQSA